MGKKCYVYTDYPILRVLAQMNLYLDTLETDNTPEVMRTKYYLHFNPPNRFDATHWKVEVETVLLEREPSFRILSNTVTISYKGIVVAQSKEKNVMNMLEELVAQMQLALKEKYEVNYDEKVSIF